CHFQISLFGRQRFGHAVACNSVAFNSVAFNSGVVFKSVVVFTRDHACVHHRVAVGVQNYRVQVNFGDVGVAFHNTGHLHDQVDQGVFIHGGLAAHTFQHLSAFQLLQHAVGVVTCQRNGSEGHVFHHLNKDATQTHHHYRTKYRVLHHTHNNFHARAGHGCNQHTVNIGLRVVLLGPDHDLIVGALKR